LRLAVRTKHSIRRVTPKGWLERVQRLATTQRMHSGREDETRRLRAAFLNRGATGGYAYPPAQAALGISNQNSAPWPSGLDTPISPPWASTIDLAIAKPRPDPPLSRLRAASER
jgi:hypothetical protein